ncbi:MAG: hypothetical protein CMB80_13695 [Flammeovirgaceae bacterium]|nr:hypothetical protein [Flammeovirgaceae bacterium]MBR06169.1 hypothetical protein [Rickettsiales bacterium]HCX20427.1 hypothetical protein [Cytophagales bacterium]|tara:strand:- start:4040 stop:5251 length:1212 start_codon:yes stop_codon:yes gene_type:complete
MKNVFFVILIFCLSQVSGQDMRPAKVVTNLRDTIHGYANYQIFGHGGDLITVWSNSTKEKINTWDIDKVYFEDNYSFKYLPKDRRRYTILAESDSISLLFQRSELFLYTNDSLYHLDDKKKSRIVNGREFMIDNKDYLLTLKSLLIGCNQDFLAPVEKSLSKGSASKTVKNYIKCTNQSLNYLSKGKSLGLFVQLDQNFYRMIIDDRVMYGGESLDRSGYTTTTLGIDVDLIHLDKLKLYAGVGFGKASFEGFKEQPNTFKTDPTNPDFYVENSFSYNLVKFPFGLQYINKIQKIRYGFILGYQHTNVNPTDFKQLVTYTYPQDGRVVKDDTSDETYFALYKIKGPEAGLNFGVDLDNFIIEFRGKYSRSNVYYERINADVGISHNISLGLHVSIAVLGGNKN